ncbi:hypothetical protein HQ489_05900 [Candidatus Woesearchaeota archaeon]|nr:hypothetical protein [Candidatus Woesearchaeota archaeon]
MTEDNNKPKTYSLVYQVRVDAILCSAEVEGHLVCYIEKEGKGSHYTPERSVKIGRSILPIGLDGDLTKGILDLASLIDKEFPYSIGDKVTTKEERGKRWNIGCRAKRITLYSVEQKYLDEFLFQMRHSSPGTATSDGRLFF